MRVIHIKSGAILGENIYLATTFGMRLRGLMFRKNMLGDGLIIDPCNSIHNCFVSFPIDVIFLSKDNRIVKVLRNFKPWRFSLIYLKASKVVELPSGKVPLSISCGDELEVLGV